MFKWDWMDNALCREVSPDIFHPGVNELTLAKQAKAICAKCPVIDKCMEYALENPSITGILAGTNEKERRDIRRRQEKGHAEGTEGLRETGTAGFETSIRIPTR